MKTEKVNLLEQSPVLPCSRVVNGFRLIPFFTATKKVAWFIYPNCSPYRFAFDSVESAERFAKTYSNNHTDSFWFNRFYPMYSIINVACGLDNLSHYEAQTNISYREQIFHNINLASNSK